jgi:ABC-2 type transport system permease protein
MIALKALIKRDLRLFFADRRAVLISFVAPICIASFFGYIFGGGRGSDDAARVPVLMIDQDGSSLSKEIVSLMTAENSLDVEPSDLDQARTAVRKGKAAVAIAIPAGFGVGIASGLFNSPGKPVVAVLYDPSRNVESKMVESILAGHVMQSMGDQAFGWIRRQALAANTPPEEALSPGVKNPATTVSERGESASKMTIPYSTNEEAITSGAGVKYNGYAHSFAGMGVQFILFTGMEIGIGLLLQRQRGLWKRLRAAPLSRAVLLSGRTISATMTALIILAVLFIFARVVFGVRIEGSMLGFAGICVAFSMMTATFGLLIAALGGTPETTRGLAIFATLIFSMLGGAWVPSFIFPQWLQKLTVVVPTRWAVDGLDAMTWRGLGLSSAIGPIAVLLFFCLAFGGLAVSRFRWEADG